MKNLILLILCLLFMITSIIEGIKEKDMLKIIADVIFATGFWILFLFYIVQFFYKG